MKFRASQFFIQPKNVAANLKQVRESLKDAARVDVDWVVFPELCLSGYFIGDAWNRRDFLNECVEAEQQIVKDCAQLQISAIFGNVTIDPTKVGEDGRALRFDSTIICNRGNVWRHPVTHYGFLSKTLLPNYGPFDDSRYFFDNRKLALSRPCTLDELLCPVSLGQDVNAAVLVCEDIWDYVYSVKPLEILKKNHVFNMGVALSASPFDFTKTEQRETVLKSAVARAGVPFLYVNQLSCQNNGKTIYNFDGESRLLDRHGQSVFVAPVMSEGYFDFTTSTNAQGQLDVKFESAKFNAVSESHKTTFVPSNVRIDPKLITCRPELFESVRYVTREFFKQIKVDKVAVGVSGGIDSGVSAALLSTILPKENIFLLNMPSQFNTKTTKNLAEELARNLGLRYAQASIQESFEKTVSQIESLRFVDLTAKLPEQSVKLSTLNRENIQARDRGARLLAAVSSALGATFICNVNKTELMSGWGTFYGDLSGVMAPLADLWKYQVYELGRYLNANYLSGNGIPEGMFKLIPSAELSEHHDVDKGMGDPFYYPYHDRLFRAIQESNEPPSLSDLIKWYDDQSLSRRIEFSGDMNRVFKSRQEFIDDLNRWWKIFFGLGVGKRVQAPPIVAVSPRPFGYDFREAQGLVF